MSKILAVDEDVYLVVLSGTLEAVETVKDGVEALEAY